MRANHVREALRDIPIWRRSDRLRAKRAAETAATAEADAEENARRAVQEQLQAAIDGERAAVARAAEEAESRAEERARTEQARRETERLDQQAALDALWERLVENEPAVTLAVLEAGFDRSQRPATAVAVDGERVTLLVVTAGPEAIPERRPNVTPTGRSTLKKRSKTEVHDLFLAILASNTLAAVRHTFALAPGAQRVATLVLSRTDAQDRYPEPLFHGEFSRIADRTTEWRQLDPVSQLEQSEHSLIERKGRTGELVRLDLDPASEAGQLVDQIHTQFG